MSTAYGLRNTDSELCEGAGWMGAVRLAIIAARALEPYPLA